MVGPQAEVEHFRRLALLTALILLVVFLPFYLLTISGGYPIPRDGTGLVIGRDFLNFWLYGRAAYEADPARYYDLPTYWRTVAAVAGAGYPGQQWSYPPSLMLLAAPFGRLPYLPALAIWSVASLLLFAAALRLWTRDRTLIAACALSPAALFGLMSGQFAFVGAAGLLCVLRWRHSRPVAAGVILGVMTIKPQIALLFPVLLLATRNWRAIAAASVTALAIAALTAAIWGAETWRAWIDHGIANQAQVLADTSLIVAPFMPTVFMNLRIAGLSIDPARAVQLLCSLGAVVAVAMIFRRRPQPEDSGANALLLAAGVVATPYLMAYDLLALSTMALLYAIQRPESGRWAMLIYLLPLINMALASAGLPGAALLPILFGVHVWRRRNG